MIIAARIIAGIVGLVMSVAALDAAVRTFVLPRGVSVKFSRIVARSIRKVFGLALRGAKDYDRRDRVMALYAPLTLLAFPAVWLATIFVGFAGMFYATSGDPVARCIQYSGSALFTLGFAMPRRSGLTIFVYIEAAIGLTLLALLISYLPSIYGAFSRREIAVSKLSVRAGTPPTAVEMLERAHNARFLDRLGDVWQEWELWFVELEETHTSLAILSYFRSPSPNRSWVTAAGAVLDAASIRMAALDLAFDASAGVCIRAGFIALRSIADFFGVEYDVNVDADTPISISREEFDEVIARLAAVGIPIKVDRDQIWRDFVGWRANYDTVLLSLAAVVMAPYAPWSSDRSPIHEIVRR